MSVVFSGRIKAMEANTDINIINDARLKLQGGCSIIPGILNDLLDSDKRPLAELNRRIETETSNMNEARSRIATLENEIRSFQYIRCEEDQRELQNKIYELNDQKARFRNCEARVNELNNQYNNLQRSFEELKNRIYQFKNYDLNLLFDASNGVNELLHVLEDYFNIL